MNWVLVSRDLSSNQDHFVDEEATLHSQDLWELHYDSGLHSLVIFSVFLE